MTDVAGIAPAPVASGGGFIKLFDNRQALLRWVIASVLGVGCLLSWFLFARATFLYDPPLMHFMAWRISEGDVPYQDFWDMNGPAIYMVHLLLLLFPGSPTQVYAGLMIVLTAACVASAAITAGFTRRTPLIGGLTGLATLVWILNAGNQILAQRDLVIAACAVGALAFVHDMPSRAWRWFVSGFLIAFAIGVKPLAAPFGLMAFAATLYLDLAASASALGWNARLRRTLGLAAGGAAGVAFWFAFLVFTGSVGAWWSTMTGFNVAEYAHIGREPFEMLAASPVMATALVGCVIGLYAAFAATNSQRIRAREESIFLLLVAGFGFVGIALYFIQGKGWLYQTVPAGLLGLLSFGAAATWLAAHGRRLLALAVMVAMLLTIRVYDLRVQISPAFQQQMAAPTGYVDDMASAMRALPPGMKVQPLDTAEGALQAMFAARREQASPIVYDFVLFSGSAEAQSKARQVLLQSIGDTRPAILITNQGWPDKRRLGHERVSSFAELHALLGGEYRLQAHSRRTFHDVVYEYRLYAPAP